MGIYLIGLHLERMLIYRVLQTIIIRVSNLMMRKVVK